MGDIEGSSNAAQRALSNDQGNPAGDDKSGFLSRLMDALSPGETPNPTSVNGQTAPVARPHGMINLRRMRVEDVTVPTAEIVSVPVTVEKDELVQVFRESGMTRIPVYEGTLDTPLGFVHLKDFALTHGFNGGTT